LSNAHARLLLFTLYLSDCCPLNFICWIFWVLGVSCALTARQEEVSLVQCACAPFVVHSVCISSLSFICWIIWVITRARHLLRNDSKCACAPFFPFRCSLPMYLSAVRLTLSFESSESILVLDRVSLTYRQPGRRRFYLSNVHGVHCISLLFA
jgi:hypothetical protein